MENQYLLFLFCHKQKQVRMNYSKYSRVAEEEKGRSNKTFYVITCTKCRKRIMERINTRTAGKKVYLKRRWCRNRHQLAYKLDM